jgi:hypothetical protein
MSLRDAATREWRSVSPVLRAFALWSFLVGLVLVALGTVGDVRGWWPQAPFLTNLASSVTGACFGIPVALVVLQRLAAVQSEVNDRNAVRRLLHRFAVRLDDAARRLAPFPLSASGVDQLRSELRDAVGDILRHSAQSDGLVRVTAADRPAYVAAVRRLQALIPALARHWPAYEQHHEAFLEALADFTSAASFLYEEIRPRAMEVDGRWLDPGLARLLADTYQASLHWPRFDHAAVGRYLVRLQRVANVMGKAGVTELPRDAPTLGELGGLAGPGNVEPIAADCDAFLDFLLEVDRRQALASRIREFAR